MADDRLQGYELQVIGEVALKFGPKWTEENLEKVRFIITLTVSILQAERMDRPDRAKVAEQLYSWHCEALGVAGELLKEQNETIRGYWMAKADQIIALCDVDVASLIFEEIERNQKLVKKVNHLPYFRYDYGKYQALKSKWGRNERS